MEVFHRHLKLLRFCGFDRNPTPRLKICLKVLVAWCHISMTFCTLTSILYAFTSNDVLNIAESIAPMSSGLFNWVKCIVYCLHMDKLFRIMDEIQELNQKWAQSKDEKKFLDQADELSTNIVNFLTKICVPAGLFYIFKPVLVYIMEVWILKVQPSYTLPFLAAFPYDVSKSPAYEITYFIQSVFAYFVVIITIATAATFSCYCLNIEAHFKILRSIANETKVKEFVEYHRKLINITHTLSDIFRPIIFIEFIIIAMTICVTGLQVMLYDDYGKIIAAILHASAAILDLALFSYGGQKVLDSSLAVCSELYKVDKIYIPIIAMSQKELKFDTGFFDASLDTMSIIVSRAMSFITLLKSFVSK